MKATVDLADVLDLLLEHLKDEADRDTNAPEHYVSGVRVGIEKAAELVRSVMALPSLTVEPEP